MIEGPRGTHPEERDSLRECIGTVFRPTLMDEYPQLFHDKNLENCRVILEDGKIVSHVGLTQQRALILGCTVGVGCIGAVSTYEEYRGKGYATQLFYDASAKCYAEGIDFMIISGDRGLYRRPGCRKIGLDYEATISVAQAEPFDSGVSIVAGTEANISTISTIHWTEPVRFLRPPQLYEHAFTCKRYGGFWLIKKGDAVRGYVVVPRTSDAAATMRVVEYAGERSSILGALGQIMQHHSCQSVELHILGSDQLMQDLLSEGDIQLQSTHAPGTVQIVNFPQLMNRMRPYFEERIGVKKAAQFHFAAEDDEYQIRYGSEEISIPDRGELGHLIFGTREETVADRLAGRGKTAELVRQLLPIPALTTGLNHV